MSEQLPGDNRELATPGASNPTSLPSTIKKSYRLTRKEAAFLGLYTNPEARNPRTGKRTYRNGTQAASAIYDVQTLATAASIASENLRKPHIVAAMELLFNASGLDNRASAQIISEIAHGTAVREAEFQMVDSDGAIRTLKSRKRPGYSDSLKAIKMRYELTGQYARTEAYGRAASKTLGELMKRHLPPRPTGSEKPSSGSEP